jgi:thiol-disulfide isomerase/thioredoxin
MSSILSFFILSTFFNVARAQQDVPDLVLHRSETQIVLTAPKLHHMNDKAPAKASVVRKGSTNDLHLVSQTKLKVIFASSAPLDPNDSIEVSAFLCDDANTYCIKKTLNGIISSFPLSTEKESALPKNTVVKTSVSNGEKASLKKDVHGFWDNNEVAAYAEAKKTGKPVLIDFYGIWCPPCNEFVQSVFPTPTFKKAASKFVLLKIDVDQESSFALKSKYKVGGYPTMVVTNPEGVEVDRIVGFLPAADFAKKLNAAFETRNETVESRILSEKGAYLDNLQKLIEVRIEQKDFKDAEKWTNDALQLKPEDEYLNLVKLQIKSEADAKTLIQGDAQKLLSHVWVDREKMSNEALLQATEVQLAHTDVLPSPALSWALDEVNTLIKRINPKTLMLEGGEVSIGDLAELKFNQAEAVEEKSSLKSEKEKWTPPSTQLKAALEFAIQSYRSLLKMYGSDSRGLSLELAFYLWRNGDAKEAAEIYQHFIAKYPSEFTFYFASSKMYLETRDLAKAREMAEKAVTLSYGDNHLRSVERLMSVLNAQGHFDESAKLGKDTLANAKDTTGLQVRSDRYANAIKKALATADANAAKSAKYPE